MARYAQPYLDSITHTNATFNSKVRELVNLMLSSGDCRMERIAEHVGVSPKQYIDSLAEEETSFSTIVEVGPNWGAVFRHCSRSIRQATSLKP
jgi:hypothetical protein